MESISGLCPSIAIQQKVISKNPRSTVGTITEIYDYLRLLFSRVGELEINKGVAAPHTKSVSEVVDQILLLKKNARINIIAVMGEQKKGEFAKEIMHLVEAGVIRARIDGHEASLEKGMKLRKTVRHTFEAYVDRLILKTGARKRVYDAVDLATNLSEGHVRVEVLESEEKLNFYVSASGAGREIYPKLFSFNSPVGACPECRGLGYSDYEEEDQGFDEDWEKYEIDEGYFKDRQICQACQGSRLNEEALSYLIGGKTISEIHAFSVLEAISFFKKLKFIGNSEIVADKILKEIRGRLEFLTEVGLDYLHLNRLAGTLSGGEEQRVRLATQLGTHLTGVLYILDEPSIGLHQVDNDRLIASLKRLRDSGNTVIVVEHDIDTMLASDYLIDLGPGAGRHGGEIVDQAPPELLKTGLTHDYLTHIKSIFTPKNRRKASKFVEIKGAKRHNLKHVDCRIPLENFVVITGVSGSGKSSLIMDVLCETYREKRPYGCTKIKGLDQVDKLIRVTQSPIGRTPRSNPATYIDAFSAIRMLFSQTVDAKKKGYQAGRFSFNTKGGRCEKCEGAGDLKVEMHFLPNVRVGCDVCFGKRFNSDTLSVLFKGKSIFDVLDMTFNQAEDYFQNIPPVHKKIKVMCEVGLGYLKLGQPAPTLSGGEAQRVKLAKELSKRSTGKTLFVLDEPTTGLHLHDIQKLLDVCHELVSLGNTVIVIEHQLDVIKSADYVIDLGPGGGVKGGEVIAAGTPEEIADFKGSPTGSYLKKILFNFHPRQ